MTNTITLRSDLNVDLIDSMGSDETVVRSARVSLGEDLEVVENEKRMRGLINYLVREGHTSTLEHNLVTFRIECPISIAREWMRHRTQSFNEISGRYAEMKPEFYIPSKDRPLVNMGSGAHPDLQHGSFELYDNLIVRRMINAQHAWNIYQSHLAQGIANEVARDDLPLGIYTRFYATANLNNWFKFLNLRDGSKGHPIWEMQQLSKLIHDHLGVLFPMTYDALLTQLRTDGK